MLSSPPTYPPIRKDLGLYNLRFETAPVFFFFWTTCCIIISSASSSSDTSAGTASERHPTLTFPVSGKSLTATLIQAHPLQGKGEEQSHYDQ